MTLYPHQDPRGYSPGGKIPEPGDVVLRGNIVTVLPFYDPVSKQWLEWIPWDEV